MMDVFKVKLERHFERQLLACEYKKGELTLDISVEEILRVCVQLRDLFNFEQLIDICGVDYSTYGNSSWGTKSSSDFGFGRAINNEDHMASESTISQYAVVYHLLSIKNNQRLRLKVGLNLEQPIIDSVSKIWNSADWFEREVFDLFGILFAGHEDLRRILTDYGFIGHPFRKDFPLIGNVEMRYDPDKKRVIYEAVSIEDRTLVPRVIRDDNRYQDSD
ncbi:MAG: NADH-quinone oxidoreductase subunit C [Piscirickettsiaceae bacterium]|nr:NADH-quinone oxidoreductase subunit C [Piscirickettsiaceae bacterium]